MRVVYSVSAMMIGALAFCGCSGSDERMASGSSAEMVADSGIVTGPAGALRVDDGGQGGVPVLFVHSFAGDSSHWEKQLAHLRPYRRALAFDLRGHGISDASPDGSYEVDNFADDIAAVADALGLERFYLVGHSLGGAAALVYAGRHPDRVAGLLLTGAPGKVPAAQAEKIIRSLEGENYQKVMDDYWSQLTKNATPHTLSKLEAGRKKMPKDRSLAIIKGVFHYDPMPGLKGYTGHRLAVISPREDTPYALHRLVRGFPVKTIPGTSHWIQLDKPEGFNRILDDFLKPVL